MLRGPPELKHFTVARSRTSDNVHVYSRLGLYVPRDGDQTMSLPNATAGSAPSLTAFAISPTEIKDTSSNDIGQQYDVPIPDPLSVDPFAFKVPFRSTMKKFEASWNGAMGQDTLMGGIEGNVRRNDRVGVDGKLTNATGRDLVDVYLAFKWKAAGNDQDINNGDHMLYMPVWPAGATLDVNPEFTYNPPEKDGTVHRVGIVGFENIAPGRGYKCRGKIQTDWTRYWLNRNSTFTENDTVGLDQSLIMLSVFDRLSPDRRTNERQNRFDILRIGAHRYDLSPALASGSMIVIAHSGNPEGNGAPLPFNVDGRVVRGNGTTLYQFIVPVDNGDTIPPTNIASNP